jgi:hypothetical protein
MNKNVIDNIYDSDLNNELEVNTMKDIINSIGFKSEEDKLMCEVIITNLEKYAAENIKQSKTVNIPYIGCIRKSPLREAIVSRRFDFKKARLSMSKEEYKDYVRQSIDELKKEERLRFKKLIINSITNCTKVLVKRMLIFIFLLYIV